MKTTEPMQITPLPGPVLLELTAGLFINLAATLHVAIRRPDELVVLYGPGLEMHYALDEAAHARVLRALRSGATPTAIMSSPRGKP